MPVGPSHVRRSPALQTANPSANCGCGTDGVAGSAGGLLRVISRSVRGDFNLAVTKIKSVVEPDGVGDDIGRGAPSRNAAAPVDIHPPSL